MRELNIGTKKHTIVECLDAPGQGNACHHYRVVKVEDKNAEPGTVSYPCAVVNFQNGPIKEFGVNGCHNEDLIAIVIDRLQHFQKGEFACYENNEALLKLEEALMWLRKRTTDREARGVEGTSNI